MSGRILIVDDERALCEAIATHLQLSGYEAVWHTNGEDAFQAALSLELDAILTDLRMPGMSGLELCERVVSNRPDVPVIVFTAFGSMDTAIQSLRVGAFDFVTKPIEMEMLTLTLERAVRHRTLRQEVRTLTHAVERARRFDKIVGSSPPMRRLFTQLDRIVDSDEGVLITGESGTGKELVARALHGKSPRRKGPFVVVNCAALPETLVESELFGHVRGAFTGAARQRKGLFLEASGGTILLDEIGELPLPLQPKLLRTLEEGNVRPLGGEREVPVDVRVLAATNRDLETAVEDGRFREDLFFRLNVIHLALPPLRARGTDILTLAQLFLEQCVEQAEKPIERISEAAASKLLSYDWPGNVRELRNAVARAVALTRTAELVVDDLPEKIRRYRTSRVLIDGEDPGELVPLEAVEKRYILHVLKTLGGNRSLAARVLGVDRKTLYNKLQRYKVSVDR